MKKSDIIKMNPLFQDSKKSEVFILDYDKDKNKKVLISYSNKSIRFSEYQKNKSNDVNRNKK